MSTTVSVFQLLQWKHAIRLEGKGLRHSSGRSVRAHAAKILGCKRGEVAERIERLLAIIANTNRTETRVSNA